jgi:hypothetical protein
MRPSSAKLICVGEAAALSLADHFAALEENRHLVVGSDAGPDARLAGEPGAKSR